MEKKKRPFIWMLLTASLCNIIFQMLRNSKDALVVTAAGAEILPYLFLWGVLPVSVVMTWMLARAMNRMNLRTLFPITTALFLLYFGLFTFFLYPKWTSLSVDLPFGLGLICSHWGSVFYYIASELWKVAMLTILFWATLNRHMPITQAKQLYPPVMISASVGALVGGSIGVATCSSWLFEHFPIAAEQWAHNLRFQTTIVFVLAAVMVFCYLRMCDHLTPREEEEKKEHTPLNLKNFLKSPLLIFLGVIQFADYVAYSLGHLLFVDTLKTAFPEPNVFNRYMSWLTIGTGIANAATALFVGPYMWKRCSWTTVAMVTPVTLLVTIGLFLGLRWTGAPLGMTLMAGSLYYVLCRAAKYSLLDSSKEIALIPLDRNLQLEGKLVMDGIAARGGRIGAYAMQVGFISIYGGIAAALPAVSIAILLFTLAWMAATKGAANDRKKSESLLSTN